MRLSPARAIRLTLVLLAIFVAVVPPGAGAIERWYSKGLYPYTQAGITSASNRAPIALFDIVIVVLVVMAVVAWIRSIRQARRTRSIRPIGRGFVTTLTLAAVVYLWFLAAWGFNYARPALETTLPYDQSRITPQAVRALAEHAIGEANRTHAAAHAAGFPSIDESPPALVAALHDVERELGRPRSTIVATPKWSLLSPFFRASGVSGMLGPFFLETLLNPDLTGPERPAVLAHEWAHLAGYAPEADASFVGLLAALRAGPAAEYSAWLDLVSESVNQLQPVTQQIVLKNLGEGPRRDQEAIRERLKSLVRPVERAAWSTYDQLLKSQGVEEGIRSYSRTIQLLIGTDVLKVRPPSPQAPRPPGPQDHDRDPRAEG